MSRFIKTCLFLFLTVTGAALVVWSYAYGQNVPFKQQWPLFEALRTTAAIIFAVVGAWLAIVYPDRLRYAFLGRNGQNQTAKSNKAMGRILSPAVHSTAILCVILLLGVTAPLLTQVSFLQQWKLELRGASYALLSLLTIWQLGTILMTLPITDQVKSEADKEALKAATEASYFNVAQHRD